MLEKILTFLNPQTLLISLIALLALVSFVGYEAYTFGADRTTVAYEKTLKEERDKYNAFKDSIEKLSVVQAESAKQITDGFNKKADTIIYYTKGKPLTNVECKPTKEFIGAWNALSNRSTK